MEDTGFRLSMACGHLATLYQLVIAFLAEYHIIGLR